jgi:uncharacterized protein YutE (UPF0331/DUF86 family)
LSSEESILRLSELGVLPADFAEQLAPIAGFRNILIHEYLAVDWDEVYKNLQRIDELYQFSEYVRAWQKSHPSLTEVP